MTCRIRGFTLVELLVVVTIIVVLLALLVPAIDKTIYQADLTVCGANQRSVGQGAVSYTLDHLGFYPYKAAIQDELSNWQAVALRHAPGLSLPYDDRPLLSTFLPINKTLNDPLAAAVDLEIQDPLANVFSNVSMWFGFKYFKESQGLLKVGQKLKYGAYNFDILVSDRDGVRGGEVQSSHPDRKDRKLFNRPYNNEEHPWLGGNLGVGVATGQAVKITISYWLTFQTNQRGPTDLNYTYQDLSVRRFTDMPYNAESNPDYGMVRIGVFVDKKDTKQLMPRP